MPPRTSSFHLLEAFQEERLWAGVGVGHSWRKQSSPPQTHMLSKPIMLWIIKFETLMVFSQKMCVRLAGRTHPGSTSSGKEVTPVGMCPWPGMGEALGRMQLPLVSGPAVDSVESRSAPPGCLNGSLRSVLCSFIPEQWVPSTSV